MKSSARETESKGEPTRGRSKIAELINKAEAGSEKHISQSIKITIKNIPSNFPYLLIKNETSQDLFPLQSYHGQI